MPTIGTRAPERLTLNPTPTDWVCALSVLLPTALRAWERPAGASASVSVQVASGAGVWGRADTLKVPKP